MATKVKLPNSLSSHKNLLVFGLVFALIGGILLYKSFALNPNLPGDVNNDNAVNVTDLSMLLSNYGQNYTPADFNADNTISILDLSILLTNYGRTYTPSPPPTVSLTANPSSINSGSSSTLSWTTTNASSCTASGAWSGSRNTSGSQSVSPTSNASYTLSCSGSGGSANDTAVVTVSTPNPPPPPPPPPPPGGGSPDLTVNGKWTCNRSVNYNYVKVISTGSGDGVSLASGCTGRIGRLEVSGVRNGDGIKVQNQANPAHDLVIESGYASCAGASTDGTHQDGIQGMGGSNITFHNFVFDCYGGGGGNYFIQRAAGDSTPTNIVCDHCALGPRHPNNINLGPSIGSGARNSLVCRPTSGRTPIASDEATSPVNVNNTIVASNDPRCASLQSLISWASS